MDATQVVVAGLICLLLVRLLLWVKFRQDWRSKKLAISTSQLMVVIVAVGLYSYSAEHPVPLLIAAVVAIALLSFVPTKAR